MKKIAIVLILLSLGVVLYAMNPFPENGIDISHNSDGSTTFTLDLMNQPMFVPSNVSNSQLDMTTYVSENWNPSTNQNLWNYAAFGPDMQLMSSAASVNMSAQLNFVSSRLIVWNRTVALMTEFQVTTGDSSNDTIYAYVIVNSNSTYSCNEMAYYSNSELKNITQSSISSAKCSDWSLCPQNVLDRYFYFQVRDSLNNYSNAVGKLCGP